MRLIPLGFTAAAVVVCATCWAATEALAALDDPRVQEVLTMVRAGLPVAVVLAETEDIGAFPELGAADLVALHDAGVPEQVLVRMIELEAADDRSAPQAEAPPAPEPLDASTPGASLEVRVERDFWITYYEVAVDGEIVSSAGKLWQGESEPGQVLRRPGRVRKSSPITALELELVPGEWEVAVGFAVTLVEDDAHGTDDWNTAAREHYVNRGVRAIETPSTEYPGAWGTPSSVTCRVAEGQTCSVTATLERRAPTALGGIPVYGVSYSAEVR